ncbi:hypothetical protein IFU39_00205 [Paenibacillus sp. CFBP 13594]|uniref:hypothetical protein n=1 Tax=Paenibacillus sp. CFBP 13594 TaxID=2774037 RepID=UPI001786D848|nr:hypothetical protein [Paenibacillus sp. CFBP 13594]MBD8836240.1 hypothetical protein [Paenibacillus sp. CFBP 13594]
MASIDFSKLNIKLSGHELADEMVKFITSKLGFEHSQLALSHIDIYEESVWKKSSNSLALLITDDPEMVSLFKAAKKIASL